MTEKTANGERENGPAAAAAAFTTIDDKNQLRSPPHYVCTAYTTSRLHPPIPPPPAAEFCLFRFADARFYDLPSSIASASASSPGITVGIFDRKHPPAGRPSRQKHAPSSYCPLPSLRSSPPSFDVHFSSSAPRLLPRPARPIAHSPFARVINNIAGLPRHRPTTRHKLTGIKRVIHSRLYVYVYIYIHE